MKQALFGVGSNVNTGDKYWIQGYTTGAAGTGSRAVVFAEAGTLSFPVLELATAPGGVATRSLVVEQNGADSAFFARCTGAQTKSPSSALTLAVAAGDLIALVPRSTGAPAGSAWMRWNMVFTPTTAGRAIWTGGTPAATLAATTFYYYCGTYMTTAFPTTFAAGRIMWGIPITMKSLYVNLSVAPGVGRQRVFQYYLNNVAQPSSAVTISGAATTGNITGLSLPGAALDAWAVQEVKSLGAPANSFVRYGGSYEPAIDGQWNTSGRLSGADYTSGQYVALPNGNVVDNATLNLRAALTETDPLALLEWYFDGFSWTVGVAPGVGQTRTATVNLAGSDVFAAQIAGAAVAATATGIVLASGPNAVTVVRLNKSAAPAAATDFLWAIGAQLKNARRRNLLGVGV